MRTRIQTFNVVNALLLIVLCVSMLYPFWNSVVKSFSANSAVLRGEVILWPVGFNTKGYTQLFRDPLFFTSFLNSVYVVALGTTLRVMFSLMSGFAFSKDGLRFRKPLFLMFVLTMFFNGGIIPTFLIINMIGLYDTRAVLILYGAMPVFHMILSMSFFRQQPASIEESAFIDGAHYWQVFTRIILPISKPLIATLVIFNAVWLYNLFMPAVLYTQSTENFVIQLYLRLKVFAAEAASMVGDLETQLMLDGEDTGSENLRMATLAIATIPIVLIYPFFQRYFIKGVTLGAVKG